MMHKPCKHIRPDDLSIIQFKSMKTGHQRSIQEPPILEQCQLFGSGPEMTMYHVITLPVEKSGSFKQPVQPQCFFSVTEEIDRLRDGKGKGQAMPDQNL